MMSDAEDQVSPAADDVPEQKSPAEVVDSVKYHVYKGPANPTWKDSLLHGPRVLVHFFENLNRAFGYKFVCTVIAVYGLQQGLGNAYFFQGRDYYFKDVAKLSPSDAQIYTASSMVPWSIKPLYGMWSDTVAVMGFFRTPVIIFGGMLGAVCLFLLAVTGVMAAVAVVFMFGVNLSVSSPDVMIDASVAEKVVEHPKFGSDLQSLCWGSMAVCSVVGFGTSGLIIQAGGPQTIFGVLIVFGLVVFLLGSLGWFGEEKTASEPTKRFCNVFEWYEGQYQEHKSLFLLAIAMSSCALFLAVGVIAVSDWNARFCMVVLIASAVPGMFYVVTRRQGHVDVAHCGLYLFLVYALTPDITTTMFYWYTDSEDGPEFKPIYVGIIQMSGYISMVIGIVLYNRFMTTWEFKKIFASGQVMLLFVSLLDIIIVSRVNTKIGVPDEVVVLISDSTLSEMMKRLIFVPMYVLAARVCPVGAEATVFAMFMSLANFGSQVSIYFGSFLVHVMGIHEDNYDNFIYLIIIRSIARLFPIPLIYYLIPDGTPQEENDHRRSSMITTGIRTKSADDGASQRIELRDSTVTKNALHDRTSAVSDEGAGDDRPSEHRVSLDEEGRPKHHGHAGFHLTDQRLK